MIKKIMFLFLLFAYVYATTFNIFMTGVFRIPAPIVFLVPLIYFYRTEETGFLYGKELFVFFIAALFFYLIGQADVTGFFALLIVAACFALLFNYVIGTNLKRMNIAVGFFFGVLLLSGIIMFIDHQYNMAAIRSLLVQEDVLQAPAGISTTIFTFGYQMAALTPFLVINAILFKRSWLINLLLFGLSLSLIFFGMQRSVLVAFAVVTGLFFLSYYKAKSILIFGMFCAVFFIAQSSIEQFSEGKKQQNILNKSAENAKGKEERGDLMGENIQIITEYPFGLLFYGKTWNDVVQHNFVYKKGPIVITSHNAYLMFITYLGPLLGVILLILLYRKVGKIIFYAFLHIKDKKNALLICLSCSFLAISINSFFHNEWLLATSGPTLFLYFAILQLSKIKMEDPILVEYN
ncbi:hypothetical protein [Pedobacter sp. R-06]|uniref:hypothetical protein n=1 Tax=Pedobacter sp. R-06 TaxID=3404051 RepID=UPI003CF98C38